MKIELRNVRHAAFASQETECFTASVWIDGRREGTVENSGAGGPMMFHPFALEERLEAHAATLPGVEVGTASAP